MSTDVAVVLMTAPTEAHAEKIAKTLVEEGLIACANLLPSARSIYRWQGKVCDEPETVMLVKCQASRFEEVKARVLSLHSYEVPEFLRLDVSAGHEPYLRWVLGAG